MVGKKSRESDLSKLGKAYSFINLTFIGKLPALVRCLSKLFTTVFEDTADGFTVFRVNFFTLHLILPRVGSATVVQFESAKKRNKAKSNYTNKNASEPNDNYKLY